MHEMQELETSDAVGRLPEIEGVAFDALGLTIADAGELNVWRWKDALRDLNALESATPWWIGDLLAFGERTWKTTYAEAAGEVGLAPKTIRNYASVARKVPRENRVPGLAWGVHAAVAKLPAHEQRDWLESAKAGGWSADELREQIRKDSGEQPEEPEVDEREAATEVAEYRCPHCDHEWSGEPRPKSEVVMEIAA